MTSMLSINRTVVMTTIRRYLPIFAFGLGLLFIATIYPTFFINGSNNLEIQEQIEASILNNFGMGVFEFFIPVIASAVIFSYLHKENSVLALHSQPFNRQVVFNSYYLAGLILLLTPIVIIGVGVGFIANIKLALQWTLEGVVGVTYIYALSTVAGILTGNILMHVFTACFFNGIAFAIFGLYNYCCELFLYGYYADSLREFLFKLSPIPALANRSFDTDYYILLAIYFALSVVFFIFSSMLYKAVKLERVTESITFNGLKPVFTIVLTLIGAVALGIMFGFDDSAHSGYRSFYIALLIGFVLSFAIAYMCTYKTLHLLTKTCAKNIVVSGLILTVAISTLIIDPFNYEDKRPAFDDIKGVRVDRLMGACTEYVDRFDSEIYYKDGKDEILMTSPKVISNYLKAHKEIIDNKPKKGKFEYFANYVRLDYDLKNGKKLVRSYYIPDEQINNSVAIKNIYESKEFKDTYNITNIKRNYLKNLVVINAKEYDRAYAPKSQKEIDEIIAAFSKDFKARTFEQQRSKAVFNLEASNTKEPYVYISMEVKKTDKNTIAYLRSKGVKI